MPWIDEEKCIGCEVCVEQCPVGAIVMHNETARIDMTGCIHCGVCHDVCPEGAVRHDSEKVPEEIRANVEMTEAFMQACASHLGDDNEKYKCLHRMMKHFERQKRIAEKTLEELRRLQNTSGANG